MGEVINKGYFTTAKKERRVTLPCSPSFTLVKLCEVIFWCRYWSVTLVISYRYMADAKKEGAVEINEEGFSISYEAEDLHEKIKSLILGSPP